VRTNVARLSQDREVRQCPPTGTPQVKNRLSKRSAGREAKRETPGGRQVRRGEPNARNERRGSFARASRCRGYITRVLTRVMTPIHQDASAVTEC
jgi:hypothetical protein